MEILIILKYANATLLFSAQWFVKLYHVLRNEVPSNLNESNAFQIKT